MSDAPDTTLDVADVGAAIPAEPAAPEPAHPETVSWDDHVKLRHENESYRKRYQPYEETFGALHEDDANAMLTLVRQLQDDPSSAAATMRQYADVLTPAQREAAREASAIDEDDPDAPLTKAEFAAQQQRWYQEAVQAQQSAAEQAAIAQVERDAKGLGYEPGTRDYVALLWEAKVNHDGDLGQAHQALTGWRQQIIDEYLAGKREGVARLPLGPEGSPATETKPITGLADSEAAMRARLDELFPPRE